MPDPAGRMRVIDALQATIISADRAVPFYDLLDLPLEYVRYRRIRQLVFNGLSGRILDAGIGTGRNAGFYPHGVSIVGIDISPLSIHVGAGRAQI
jgi:SAM-dependent methyltransferase